MGIETRHFINNEFVESIGKETFEVYNPATEKLVANVQAAQPADVDAAVDAASAAFPEWAKTAPSKRAELLRKFAELIRRDTEILGKLESQAMGCPTGLYAGTVDRTCAALEHCAALALLHIGQASPQGMANSFNVAIKQPYGVCAAIIPWNVTILLLAFKVGPAVAAGNTIVVKSSEKSPLSSLHIAKLVKEAGFPKGVINIISGLGHVAGQAMAEHMRIRKISFTGSHFTGKKVSVAAAQSNLKRVTLELGGKGPSIVFEDSDIERAAKACAGSIFRNSGQICSTNSRVYVHESIASKFIELYKSAYVGLVKHGDPLDITTTQGPLVDKLQFKRVMDYIDIGKKEGELVTGGKRARDTGYFVEPTVFTNVDDCAKINREEIFGPVSIIHTFKTEEEALKRANDTEYGLTSSVYTRDMERALRVAQALETGQVGINSPNQVATDLPYGGWKVSGTGRELGPNALDAYSQDKVIYIPVADK